MKNPVSSISNVAHCRLALRRIVSFSRAHSWLARHAADLYFDGPVFSIARFVGGIVSQAVLRSYFIGYLRKCRLRILQTRGNKVSATAGSCQIVHLTPRKVVKVTADRHLLERA